MDYWQECISEAFDDIGIQATEEQKKAVAEWVEGAYDNYDMAMGHECIPNSLVEENKKLKADLKKEQEKVVCPECKGKGSITDYGPYHSATSDCFKCKGESKI